jgi:D-aminoacyl-tRNA deacylase
MRALIQRVAHASVTVDEQVTGRIDRGLLVFLGVTHHDTDDDARYLASRVAALRVFNDADDKMNLSVRDVDGSVLVVSQFTLHADTRKGNRPSYGRAAPLELAEKLYNVFLDAIRVELGPKRVAAGVFRAMMRVELLNDGPVTVMLYSRSEYEEQPRERPPAP